MWRLWISVLTLSLLLAAESMERAAAQDSLVFEAKTLLGTWTGTHAGAGTLGLNAAELRFRKAQGNEVSGVYRLDIKQDARGLQIYYNNDVQVSGHVEGSDLYLKTNLGVAHMRLKISSLDGKLTMTGIVEGQARAFNITLQKE